jgi:hypothetical protein
MATGPFLLPFSFGDALCSGDFMGVMALASKWRSQHSQLPSDFLEIEAAGGEGEMHWNLCSPWREA